MLLNIGWVILNLSELHGMVKPYMGIQNGVK